MGRPRTFDRDKAVQQAMYLFWEYGYESTSLSLLKSNIGGGISAPSFYAAFGSKERLFKEVVELYISTYGQVNISLWNSNLSPRESIELTLRGSAKMQTENGHPRGCLLVLSANTCSPENKHIQSLLSECRARTKDGFLFCIQRAIKIGEISSDTNAWALATSFHSFLCGLSNLARDGISGTMLDAAVTEMMLSWDTHRA
jgi:AcrR family transcriptional regulator